MSVTDNLAITEMTAAQSQKETTFNEALKLLDYIIGGILTHDMASDANYTLNTSADPDENYYGKIDITDTGVVLTAGRDIVCSTIKRKFWFKNSTAQTLTVKCSGQTGVAVTTGQEGWLFCNGTDIAQLASSW